MKMKLVDVNGQEFDAEVKYITYPYTDDWDTKSIGLLIQHIYANNRQVDYVDVPYVYEQVKRAYYEGTISTNVR